MMLIKDRNYLLKNLIYCCECGSDGHGICTECPFEKYKIEKDKNCFFKSNLNNSLKILVNSSYKDVIDIIKKESMPIKDCIIKFVLERDKLKKDKKFILG